MHDAHGISFLVQIETVLPGGAVLPGDSVLPDDAVLSTLYFPAVLCFLVSSWRCGTPSVKADLRSLQQTADSSMHPSCNLYITVGPYSTVRYVLPSVIYRLLSLAGVWGGAFVGTAEIAGIFPRLLGIE